MVTYSWKLLCIRGWKKLKTFNNDNSRNIRITAIDNVFKMLENVSFDSEGFKLPDTSKVCHVYICTKTN